MDFGQPKAGETLVVSAAGGAVGSLAGQMGKIAGCRNVGKLVVKVSEEPAA